MTVVRPMALLALGTVLALANGCGGEGSETEGGTLPPLSSDTSAAQSVTQNPPASEEEESAVRSAYLSYLPTYRHAQELPPTLRKRYLSRWEVDPQLTRDLKDLARDDRVHYRDMGSEISHIMSVRVEGSKATVDDCLDRGKTYVVDSRTGRRIDGTNGYRHIWAITRFRRVGRYWLVYDTAARRMTCNGP